jgi:hypothetical protein
LNHGLADWAKLETDELIKLITTVRGSGQSEPAAGRNLTHGMLKGGSRYMVAFIDNNKSVARCQRGEVVTTGKRLQGCDVDHAASLGPSSAPLAGLLVEQFVDTGAPLVGEGLPIDKDQSRYAVGGHQGTGDYGLAGTGRGDQYTEVVNRQSIGGLLLFGVKCGREIECVGIALTAFVNEIQTATGLLDQIAQPIKESARQD